jgi:hypothetical protein
MGVVALGLLLGGVARPTRADTINLATGLDGSDNRILVGGAVDAHWTVPPLGTATGPQTVFPGNADSGFPDWIANGPSSDWIARDANTADQGATPYTFSRTFNLTGFDLSTVSISGSWTLDDVGELRLNGNLLGTLSGTPWFSFHPFSVPAGSPFLNQGLNTLTITITSSDRFLEGVRLEGTLTGTIVPEPSALALLALGTFGLLGRAWRRRSA